MHNTVYIYMYLSIDSLAPSDFIWQHRTLSTLVQVMACCLTAPSHNLNQCWLIIKGVLWHSPESNFTSAHKLNCNMRSAILYLKSKPHLPGHNELNSSWHKDNPHTTRNIQRGSHILYPIEYTHSFVVLCFVVFYNQLSVKSYDSFKMQKRHNSIATALELHLFCIKPSNMCIKYIFDVFFMITLWAPGPLFTKW